jgi:hypothetical protein
MWAVITAVSPTNTITHRRLVGELDSRWRAVIFVDWGRVREVLGVVER